MNSSTGTEISSTGINNIGNVTDTMIENESAVLFNKMDMKVVKSGTIREPNEGEVRIKMKCVGICGMYDF